MIDILIYFGVYILVPAILIGFGVAPYFRERSRREQAEHMLDVVRQMGDIDDRIFRMRCDDPEDWPESAEAKMLIARRVSLHEEYSSFLRHQPLRDCEWMTELMKSAVSKK